MTAVKYLNISTSLKKNYLNTYVGTFCVLMEKGANTKKAGGKSV